MSVRRLLVVQTHDPGRGSFLVNPRPVNGKRVQRRPVYESGCASAWPLRPSWKLDRYEFIVVDGRA